MSITFSAGSRSAQLIQSKKTNANDCGKCLKASSLRIGVCASQRISWE
jgi:hypothetical protein